MSGDVLTRVHSLRERLDENLSAHRNEILLLLSKYMMFSLLLITTLAIISIYKINVVCLTIVRITSETFINTRVVCFVGSKSMEKEF